MSLFAVQLDIRNTGIFLFEKAVALWSYWLTQGITSHGKHAKAIQSQKKQVGEWVMGVCKGDMIAVLNEQESMWSTIALLLPLAVVLSSANAAEVLVQLSNHVSEQLGPLELLTVTESSPKKPTPLSFETGPPLMLALISGDEKAFTGAYSYRAAQLGTSGEPNAAQEGEQWRKVKTHWMLSDYLWLCVLSWVIDPTDLQDLQNTIADCLLAFWHTGHIYGALGSQYIQSLSHMQVNHQCNGKPSVGLPVRTLFAIEQVVGRIQAFNPSFVSLITWHAEMEDGPLMHQPSGIVSVEQYGIYCPLCVITSLNAIVHFLRCVLSTMLFLMAAVGLLPHSTHIGEKLDLSHVLESTTLLLGSPSKGSLTASRDVIGIHVHGCSIYPNTVITISTASSDNLVFHISPGELFCCCVHVKTLHNSSWVNMGSLGFSGAPIDPSKITVVLADNFEPTLLEMYSTPSTIVLEATLKDSAGYLVFHVTWLLDDEEKSEWILPVDVLFGMSAVPTVACMHLLRIASYKVVMMSNVVGVILNSVDMYNYLNHLYAMSVRVEAGDCFAGFNSIVAAGMKDRGHLLRALQYMQGKVQMGMACLACSMALVIKEGASVVYAD
ncbi:hypothetical protein B0H10DRAFT_2207925 [Mycena sp. CBHHK59/15]|nr:hypothetical protein B0H10DRAFT_2207925 [Mycena sp. CBHHK59/15]